MSPRSPRPAKVRPPAPDAIDTPWRLFLAVPLTEDARNLVEDQVTELTAEGWPVRWVRPENAHLTLHFLGETERDDGGINAKSLHSLVWSSLSDASTLSEPPPVHPLNGGTPERLRDSLGLQQGSKSPAP